MGVAGKVRTCPEGRRGQYAPALGLLYTVNYFIIDESMPFDGRKVQAQIGDLMKSSVANLVKALGLVAIGVAICATGIYLGETDDAPGAALIGILLMIGAVVLGVRIARRKT